MIEEDTLIMIMRVCVKFLSVIFIIPLMAIFVREWLSVVFGVICIDNGLYWTGVALIMVGWFMFHRTIFHVELEDKE